MRHIYWTFKPLLLFVLSLVSFLQVVDIPSGKVKASFDFLYEQLLTRRPIFFLLTIGLFYLAAIAWRYKDIPITVVHSEIDIFIDTNDGARVRINRTQVIRANRPDVTAYFQHFAVVGDGKIPRNEINCKIFVRDMDFWWNPKASRYQPDNTLQCEGTERGWDVIHSFNPPIPITPFLPPILRCNTVRRSSNTLHLNQFTKNEESYDILTLRYPHKKLSLTIHFHPDRPPDLEHCKALRIVDNGVVRVGLDHIPAGKVGGEALRLTVKRSRNERYRITWRYKSQEAAQQSPRRATPSTPSVTQAAALGGDAP